MAQSYTFEEVSRGARSYTFEEVTPKSAPPTVAPERAVPDPFPASDAAAVAAGAMGGAALGVPAGPMGVLAGGVLGAGAGYLTKYNIDRGMKALGVMPEYVELPTAKQATERAIDEMTMESAFSGGIAGIGQLARVGRKAWERTLATNEGRMLMGRAREFGINLGIVDVSESGAIRGWPKVVGRIPFFGGPFRRAKERQAQEVLAAREKILWKLGPSVGLAEMGVQLNEAADAVYGAFRNEANRRYEGAFRLAEERGVIVPTDEIVDAITKQEAMLLARRPPLAEGVAEPAKRNPAMEFMEKYKGLGPTLDMNQLDGLLEDIDVYATAAKQEGWQVRPMAEVKKAVEVAMSKMEGDNEAVRAFREADDYFAKTMLTFESPAGQKFGGVQRHRFRVGLKKPGRFNPDEMFDKVWTKQSPEGLKQLRDLVGTETFAKAARAHIERTWDKAVERAGAGKVFNAELFARSLGLDNPKSPQYAALDESLRNSGLKTSDLKDFTDIVRATFKEGVPDPSTFVARRAVLGGARSAMRAFLPFAAVGGSGGALLGGPAGSFSGLAMATAASYMAYRGSKFLARPREMKLMIDMLDEAKPLAYRSQAAVRLIRLAPGAFGEPREAGNEETQQGLNR